MGGLELRERRGEIRGEQRGIQIGRLQMLMKLLTKKFGPLPDAVREKLNQADRTQLELWGARILAATSLDEVLA